MSKVWIRYGQDGRQTTYELLQAAGFSQRLRPGLRVGLKPNLVVAKASASGATTDPEVTAGVLQFLQDHGIKQTTILESSWVGASTKLAFQVCGYENLASEFGARLLDLKNDRTISKRAGKYELEICSALEDLDLLINLPVLKAHCQTKMTCALKNSKGCIPDKEKRRFHSLGLHGPIAALNTVLPAMVTVVDAIIGDLTFEEGGTPVNMGRVLYGEDPVAIDAYAAQLLGFEPEEIEYIVQARSLQVGSYPSEIIETNPEASRNREHDRRSLHAVPLSDRFRARISEKDACSSCLGSLLQALQRLEDQRLPLPKKVFIGQGWQNSKLDALGIGQCCAGAPSFVAGCPPTAAAIVQHLRSAQER